MFSLAPEPVSLSISCRARHVSTAETYRPPSCYVTLSATAIARNDRHGRARSGPGMAGQQSSLPAPCSLWGEQRDCHRSKVPAWSRATGQRPCGEGIPAGKRATCYLPQAVYGVSSADAISPATAPGRASDCLRPGGSPRKGASVARPRMSCFGCWQSRSERQAKRLEQTNLAGSP